MKVALGQIACVPGDPAANTAAMLAAARRAREAGCAAVLFPEMSDTGYPPGVVSAAAAAGTERVLRTAAESLGCWILAGLSEPADGRLYNSLAVFSPDGAALPRYRKLHLFRPPPACEEQRFARGGVLRLCRLGEALWGLSVCYDLRFPELYRRYALAGARVLVNCAAWPRVRAAHWRTLLRARAIENQCFVLGVNHAGSGRAGFCGRSAVIAPSGEALAEGAARGEALVVAELDLDAVEQARRAIPVLEDRRPEGYDTLPLETDPAG
jgi:predicted amidohydrolase